MKPLKTISKEHVCALLRYDPSTGIFRWRVRRGSVAAGTVAGTLCGRYIDISIDRSLFKAHRLAWVIMTGHWPQEIDHVNCNKSDNRWSNLRDCTRKQNSANRGAPKSNKSGLPKGVRLVRCRDGSLSPNPYGSQLRVGGRHIWLGCFPTKEQASAAYLTAAKAHFGEFARVA